MGRKQPHRLGISSSARRSVIARDGKQCRYCGKEDLTRDLEHEGADHFLTLDHVDPSCNFSGNIQTNLVVACYACNHRKGDASLVEIGWALLPPRLCRMSKAERSKIGWTDEVLEKQRDRIASTSLKKKRGFRCTDTLRRS